MTAYCRCGHPAAVHEHYRPAASECAERGCGCPRLRRRHRLAETVVGAAAHVTWTFIALIWERR